MMLICPGSFASNDAPPQAHATPQESFSMAKTLNKSPVSGRISKDDLAEQWYSFRHEIFAELNAAVARSGMTQEEIAARLDITHTAISHYLSGRRNMTLTTLCEIAYAIGCRPEIRFQELPANRRDAPASFAEPRKKPSRST